MNGHEEKSVLDQLDKLPQIRAFDAFPKTQPMYLQRSGKGGLLTILVAFILLLLAIGEGKEYLYGQHGYSFHVDQHVGQDMQINIDLTVAMKCHYLTVDIRDAVGDHVHITDSQFIKDGTTFEIGHAGRLDSIPERDVSAQKTIDASKKKVSKTTFGKDQRPSQNTAFKKTAHIVPDGPACRIYGSMAAKKVTGNLHITTLGHGYWSFEHTDHAQMNLSHVIHEFSFGPYFPEIAQPLDSSVEISNEHFAVFQYFVSIIPTTFIDRWGRKLHTNQYSVNDYSRTVKHGQGVPGIFIKYDIEALTMTIKTRTTSLAQFLARLAGIIGGVYVCIGYSYRIGQKAVRVVVKMRGAEEENYDQYASSISSSYRTNSTLNGSTISRGTAAGRWTDSSAIGSVTGRTGKSWSGGGMGHRPTASVVEKVMSEEGRAW